MDEERSFDERETALILSRAAELSRPKARGAETDVRSNTLAELERIAREAGIAPELVREAAAEVVSRGGKRTFGRFILGGATKKVLSADVPVAADKATLDRVLLELPRAAGSSGSGFVSPEGLTWSTGTDAARSTGSTLSVEVRVQDGRTTVEIAENRGGVAGGLFGGIAGGIGAGVGLPLALALGLQGLRLGAWSILLGLAPMAVAWLCCRLGFGAFAKKRDVKLERLRGELRRILDRREGPREP